MPENFNTPSLSESEESSKNNNDKVQNLMNNLAELKSKDLGPEEQVLVAEIEQQVKEICSTCVEERQDVNEDVVANHPELKKTFQTPIDKNTADA